MTQDGINNYTIGNGERINQSFEEKLTPYEGGKRQPKKTQCLEIQR